MDFFSISLDQLRAPGGAELYAHLDRDYVDRGPLGDEHNPLSRVSDGVALYLMALNGATVNSGDWAAGIALDPVSLQPVYYSIDSDDVMRFTTEDGTLEVDTTADSVSNSVIRRLCFGRVSGQVVPE